jgi:hypothetical protein
MATAIAIRVCRTLVLVGGLSAAIGSATAAPTRLTTVQLRLIVHATLDSRNLRLAEDTADALLASAGILGEWRDCSQLGRACEADRNGALYVLVQLLPMTKMGSGDVCGEVVPDGMTHAPTVLVYLPRNVELARSIRSGSIGRSNPALATVATGHLVGLTVAHEVGHALGLRHASSGVMKARPSLDDVVALRALRLLFQGSDAATIRQTMRAHTDLVARAR